MPCDRPDIETQLTEQTDDGSAPLLVAAQNGHFDVVQFLTSVARPIDAAGWCAPSYTFRAQHIGYNMDLARLTSIPILTHKRLWGFKRIVRDDMGWLCKYKHRVNWQCTARCVKFDGSPKSLKWSIPRRTTRCFWSHILFWKHPQASENHTYSYIFILYYIIYYIILYYIILLYYIIQYDIIWYNII